MFLFKKFKPIASIGPIPNGAHIWNSDILDIPIIYFDYGSGERLIKRRFHNDGREKSMRDGLIEGNEVTMLVGDKTKRDRTVGRRKLMYNYKRGEFDLYSDFYNLLSIRGRNIRVKGDAVVR